MPRSPARTPRALASFCPCAYPDCTHTHEDRCAVKRAALKRQVSASRYTSYLGLFQGESAG